MKKYGVKRAYGLKEENYDDVFDIAVRHMDCNTAKYDETEGLYVVFLDTMEVKIIEKLGYELKDLG